MPTVLNIAADAHGRLAITSPPWAKDTIKATPGRRWDDTRKVWTIPATTSAVEAIARGARAAGYTIEGDEAFARLLDDARAAFRARKMIEAAEAANDPLGLADIPGRTAAWNHQRQAYHFARPLTAAMLAMDMGTGKTKTATGLLDGWDTSVAVVLCPKAVVGVWPREFAKHSERAWFVTPLRSGTAARKAAKLLADFNLAKAEGRPFAVIVNYETAWRTAMGDALKYVLDQAPGLSVVVADESHKIKAPGGRASRFAHNLGHHASKRLALTGTPMPHNPLDIYAQCRFLDEGIFGTSYNAFKNRYGIWGGFENRRLEGLANENELAALFGRLAFQCKAEDVLDLPELRDEPISVDLSPEALRVYADLESDFVARVGDGIVTAANAGVKVLRLQQVTSGYLPLDDPDEDGARIVAQIDTAKREALKEIIEDLPRDPRVTIAKGKTKPLASPFVVFARFRHDLDQIALVAEELGLRYRELSGRRRDAIDSDSHLVEDCDVAAVQIQAGGVGIDLTRARYGCYYSIGHSLGDYLQSRKRLHRPGQDHPVLFYHLVADGTVDVTIYGALQRREDVIKAVLAEAKKHTLHPTLTEA